MTPPPTCQRCRRPATFAHARSGLVLVLCRACRERLPGPVDAVVAQAVERRAGGRR